MFDVLEAALAPLGFEVHRFVSGGEVENLFATPRRRRARISASPAISTWSRPARAGAAIRSRPEIRGGLLYGRGAVDMKGGIAAFVAAAARGGRSIAAR